MKRIRVNILPKTTNCLKKLEHVVPIAQYYMGTFNKSYNKYNNIAVIDEDPDGDPIGFQSISEWKYWRFLLGRIEDGSISDLKCQAPFKLGKRTYIVDFTYLNENNEYTVVDVKSPSLLNSPRFKEAQKGMLEHYGLTIKIVPPDRLLMW